MPIPGDLKNIRAALDALGTCPECGLTRFVMATSWRGHGTGRHGSSQYEATSFERVSPETHCVCVGGPVWEQVRGTEFGNHLRMGQAEDIWRRLPEKERKRFVVFYSPEQECWIKMGLCGWLKALREHWQEI